MDLNNDPAIFVKRDEAKPRGKIPLTDLTREQLAFRRKNVYDQLVEMEESLHYAKQDVAAYFSSLNIQNPEKRMEAERALEQLKKEFELLRQELSDIDAV